jgi:ABC-type dipeptide/oligopeptide/nickel transport system permease component
VIPILGKNLAIAGGRLLLLSVVIFLILDSTGAYVEADLSFLDFLKSTFSGRLVEGPSAGGLPPLRPALLYSSSTLLWALVFSYGFGLPMGLVLSRYRSLWTQVAGQAAISVALAIPAFWVAYVVLYYAIHEWGIFIGGEPELQGDGWRSELVAKSLLLAIPVSLSGFAVVARQVALTLSRAFPQPTLLFARSMGLNRRTPFDDATGPLIWRPVLPAFPYLCSIFLSILIAAETAFFVPGFGYAVFKAAQESDLQRLAVLSLWVSTALLLANFVVDVLIEMIDSRHPASPIQE